MSPTLIYQNTNTSNDNPFEVASATGAKIGAGNTSRSEPRSGRSGRSNASMK